MLLVEQNAALALDLADHAYLLETGRVVLAGPAGRAPEGRRHPPRLPRVLSVDTFLQQVVSGLATGGIYASLALALVMIYQATEVVNFAQGEMAMFSTYLAWSMLNAACRTGSPSSPPSSIAFVGGVLIERIVIRPVEARRS